MAETFSFDEAMGATVPTLVPAKRTRPTVSDFSSVTIPEGSLLPPKDILENISKAAKDNGVPLPVMLALAHQESTYRPDAVGKPTKYGRAKGMFQYIDATAKGMGIDPLDYIQSAGATARQLSSRLGKGLEWAIAAHHAGDNPKQHGPITAKYTAEVLAKASAIAKELGEDFQLPEVEQGPETFSFEEAFTGAPPAAVPEKEEAPKEPGLLDTYKEKFSFPAVAGQVITTARKGWAGLQEAINADTIEVDRTDQQLQDLYKESPYSNPASRQFIPFDTWAKDNRQVKVSADAFADQELAIRKGLQDGTIRPEDIPKAFSHLKPPSDLKSLLGNLENPAKRILEDSLPANMVQFLANAPEHERRNFDEARKVMMQENIVANPDKFPAVSVEAARKAIEERKAKADPGIVDMWNDLKQAANEAPGRFGAALINSLMADPYMMAAPVGIGAKPIQAIQAARGVTIASRAAKIADSIVDAGSVAAAMNVAAGAGENLATTGAVSNNEAKLNAALGYLIGGPLGAIFMRGAKAKAADLAQSKITGDYENILKAQAESDVAVENIVTGRTNIDRSVRNRVEQILGIKSNAEREAWLKAWRKQVRDQFKEESDYYDYQNFVAEERMRQASESKATAEAAEARRAAAAAEAGAVREQARLQEEYEAAVAERDAMEVDDAHAVALADDKVFEATRKLNNEEFLQAIYTKDDPTIKQTLAKIDRREANLRIPKYQRGEADPKTLARIGAVGLGAAAGFALSPEDQKLQGSFLGGLAGLVIPGGGNILSRMRQSGAISPDGDIISLLTRQGKLANKLEADELLARDAAWTATAKSGNQNAFGNLYNTYAPEITRYIRKLLKDQGRQLGIDPEDLTQEAFLKMHRGLDSYDPALPFGAWARTIARNEVVDLFRRMNADKRIPTAESSMDATATPKDKLRRVSPEIEGGRDSYSGDARTGSDVYELGAGSEIYNTPETQAIRQESEQLLLKAFEKLPKAQRDVMVLSKVENYTAAEIAEMLDMPLGTVNVYLARGEKTLVDSIKGDFKVPRGQRGEIDSKFLKAAGLSTAGGLIALGLSDKSEPGQLPWKVGVGVITGLLASKVGADLVGSIDRGLGASSTRVLNHSPKIHRATVNLFRKILEDTHTNFQKVDPFISRLKQMPPDVQDVVQRAVMTGDGGVIKKLLDHLGDTQLKEGYKSLRSSLDSLGDQLQTLNRFKKGVTEYFPRVVTDKEGLLTAVRKKYGNEEGSKILAALDDANAESMRKNGRGLNQVEESALINQLLFAEKRSTQPGWTKNRKIEEITPELQKFYASPAESLHTYIRSAVEDINKAKFFGKYAKNMKKGEQEFLDTDRSVNNLIAEERKAGNITDEGAREIASVLKSVMSDKAPAKFVQAAKNLSYAGLLGNFWSAGTQLGDVVMQTYLQGITPTLESVVRQVTGKQFVDMKDFGLLDSLTAEFATQGKTARYLNKVFKYSLFQGIDKFGKNTALNAAIARARNSVQTEAGQLRFANKYSNAFGDDVSKLISELKSGKFSDLTKEWAFMELSRSQPVTRFEMSQWWLDSPNVGRSATLLKSFMLKQVDIARRDAFNLIKQGKIGEGALKLTQLGIVLGLAGTASDVVKQFMTAGVDILMGDEPTPINVSLSDIPINMFKTFGMTEYIKDQALGVTKEEAKERRAAGDKGAREKKPEPHKAAVEYFTPPFKMWTDLATADPMMYRYLIPGFGPYVARKMKQAEDEKRERAAKRKKGGTL